MTRTSTVMFLAIGSILLLVSPAVLAARVPTKALEEGGWMPFGGDAAALRAMIFGSHKQGVKDDKDSRAVVSFKFIVPPPEKDDFIDAWKKVEEGTKQEKGVLIYDLKKTEIDNFIFLQYGEWESKDDFMEHYESDYVQEFVSFCGEHEIVWLMNPLLPVVDDPDTPPQGRNHDDSEGPAHVLFRYFVPADKHKDFVEAFQDAAEETWKEEGNHIYSLRKTITDNVEFWGYGTWDSMEDYVQHFKSDYVRNLRKFARENGIVWMLAPLYKIGDQPELAF